MQAQSEVSPCVSRMLESVLQRSLLSMTSVFQNCSGGQATYDNTRLHLQTFKACVRVMEACHLVTRMNRLFLDFGPMLFWCREERS